MKWILLTLFLFLFLIVNVKATKETLWVNANDTTHKEWSTVGSEPFIDNDVTSKVWVVMTANRQGYFFFENSTGTGTINKVILGLDCSYSMFGTDLRTYLHNGTTDYQLLDVTCPAQPTWEFKEIDVTEHFPTWQSIDDGKIFLHSAGLYINVRRANLTIDYTESDTTSPIWYNNKTNYTFPITYEPNKPYQFNISWNDTYFNTALIQHNFTGTLTNYSFSGNLSNEYYYNHIDLASNTYEWCSFANDTSNNWNKTDVWTFTIDKDSTSTIVYLNNTTTTDYYIYNNSILNTTVVLNISGKTVYLESNYSDFNTQSGTTPLYNHTTLTTSTNNTFLNFTGYFIADDNYTSSSQTRHAVIYFTTSTTTTTSSIATTTPIDYDYCQIMYMKLLRKRLYKSSYTFFPKLLT